MLAPVFARDGGHNGGLGEQGSEMTVTAAVVAFVALVVVLSVLNSRRTQGRSCCAPASPADDLRMRAASTEADDTDAATARGGRRANPRA